MQETLHEIGRRFRLPGIISSCEVIKNGNINHTYKVTYRADGGTKTYVFQKVNTNVFRDPEAIMENIDRVTAHLRSKGGGAPCLHFHHTADGRNFTYDGDGGFWRVMNFIDSVTFDTCGDPAVLRAAGEAFGRFQLQLSDFDGSVLHETIPDFHNTRRRLDTLFADAAKYADTRNTRIFESAPLLCRLRSYYKEACLLSDRYNAGEFPVRVTHNDTKANNVLFDRVTLRPLAVIDLDTVMPGMAMYDFGDAVRFLASTAAEDEADPDKVSFDEGKFTAFTEGFIGAVRHSLTQDELGNMVRGAFSITVELAARFLDDYLCGDTYFRVDYPGHNLVRARNQLRLAEDIFGKSAKLQRIVAGCAAG